MKQYHDFRIAVIGAGPAGASAAIYLARNIHPVILIDAPKEVHGRTSMATSLENFLTHDKRVKGTDFIDRINQQLANYSIERVTDLVTKVSKAGEEFTITTKSGQPYTADFVVVAVGIKDIMPKIDGLDPYYDTAIFHCLTCDWYQHKDKKAVMVTNSDEGITNAIAIAIKHAPPAIAVVPENASPQFSEYLIEQARAHKITVYPSPLSKLEGEGGKLQAVHLADQTRIEAAVLFTYLGHQRLDQFLDEGGIAPERDRDGFIKVNFETFASSVPGLYAVGPCNQGPDQAIIAAGEGALAAQAIHDRILAALHI